jgi:hypothetical protein
MESPAVVFGAPPSGHKISPPACAWKTYEARAVSACCRSGGRRVRCGWCGPRMGAPRVLPPTSGQ